MRALPFAVLLAFAGCAVVSSGHRVPLEAVDAFKPGVTTQDDVLKALGKPETVSVNTLDSTTVFNYHSVVDRVFGLGLPPFIWLARKADDGFQLNVAFAGGVYRGHVLTRMDQHLGARAEPALAGGEVRDAVASAPEEPVTGDFGEPRLVNVRGFDDHAMEPFVTRDGSLLFFNNQNSPPERTDVFWARRTGTEDFTFAGKVEGAAQDGVLDGVPTMDSSGRFYFVTLRSLLQDGRTIYAGRYKAGRLSDVAPVSPAFQGSGVSRVFFDVEVSADGSTLYAAEGAFARRLPVPDYADIRVAVRRGGEFVDDADAQRLVAGLNTGELEYAVAVSPDHLELYFTRLHPKTLRSRVLRARRRTTAEPFGRPERIASIAGGHIVEAATVSPDGRTLYFHRKDDDGRHRLYAVSRR